MAEFNLMFAIRIYITFLIFSLIISVIGSNSESDQIHALPYCDHNKSSTQGHRDLVIVSTLDGRVSALDVSKDGLLEWSISTGPGQLLSSSIHRLELTNNGHWVRMIPSLSGGLYRFNGDSIEAIPITADTLLKSSSFLFSDDLVISGGKESRTYGVTLNSGQVVYECSMKGCDNPMENISVDEDLLVIQRKTQTVRAVEVRTGGERWNFSVGLHDLKLVSDAANNCHGSSVVPDFVSETDLEFKVIVPEGLVCAISKSGSHIVWKHKFDSPVVMAWHLSKGRMRDVDLFGGSRWPSEGHTDGVKPAFPPALYLGMHLKQLYIQESVNVQQLVQNGLTDESPRHLRLPWVPVPARGGASLGEGDDVKTTTALAVLYASEYVNGDGFYLFPEEAPRNLSQCDVLNITLEAEGEEARVDDTPVQIIIVSLWHWWKEVLIISVTTAALLNLLINRNLAHLMFRGGVRKEIVVVEKHVPVEPDPDPALRTRTSSESRPADYTSRYRTDFEQLHCLGRGGFGVVFEAKNRIDDCCYAIKRIALPNRQESRDRVMREVKALAKLDHPNIVRYFNAWLECPPAGWEEDRAIDLHGCNSVDDGYSDLSSQVSHSRFNLDISPLLGNTSRGFQNVPFRTNGMINFKSNSLSLPPKFQGCDGTTDHSDSFIVFNAHNASSPVSGGENQTGREESVILNLAPGGSESGTKESPTWRRHDEDERSTTGRRTRPSCLEVATPPPTRVYLFIQMQLCRKESLREWLRDNTGRRDTAQVLHIFGQIVQAVEYVHLQGLIHRDLKPSNIFFSPDGQIKVGDFGLVTAMVEGEDGQRTPSEASAPPGRAPTLHTAQVGTQLYMSPEQLLGLAYSYKVDIYSLGLVLFELLEPFETQMERGRTLSDLRRNHFPERFRREREREYELLRSMLSHDPDERPTTFGIRARPPFCQGDEGKVADERWHFELPQRRDSNKSLSTGSSVDSSSWEQV